MGKVCRGSFVITDRGVQGSRDGRLEGWNQLTLSGRGKQKAYKTRAFCHSSCYAIDYKISNNIRYTTLSAGLRRRRVSN